MLRRGETTLRVFGKKMPVSTDLRDAALRTNPLAQEAASSATRRDTRNTRREAEGFPESKPGKALSSLRVPATRLARVCAVIRRRYSCVRWRIRIFHFWQPVCTILVVSVLLLEAGVSRATWSIVATDPETSEVGIAGASCIGDVDVIGGVVPGHGVIAAQGITNTAARERGQELLAAGESPQKVLAEITGDAFDPNRWWSFTSGAQVRQYAVVALGFEAAPESYTGRRTLSWAGSKQANGVSVQGNLLAAPEVVAAALARFEELSGDCRATLHDRLIEALEAGANAGGDRRCERSLAALSAFLEVAGPDDPVDAPELRIVVNPPFEPERGIPTVLRQLFRPERASEYENPLTKLRAMYDEWRRVHEPVGRCSNEGKVETAP